jgi:hypothetical protein
MDDWLIKPLWSAYESDAYLSRLQKRFPFLADKTKEELLSALDENKNRDQEHYDYNSFHKYEKNLKEKFTPAIKNKIIKKRAEKYLNKWYYDTFEAANERSKSEMMPTKEYTKFAAIATQIFAQMDIQPNRDNLTCSVNRYGEHSWYLFFGSWKDKYAIKISDHFAIKSFYTKEDIPIKEIIIVDYKNNRYLRLDSSYLEFLHEVYNWSEIYEKIEEDMQTATKWLKKFIRSLDPNERTTGIVRKRIE